MLNIVRSISASARPIRFLVKENQSLSRITVNGWVTKTQKTSQFNFVHLNDGLSVDTVQVVIPKHLCSSVPMGSALEITGTWSESSGSKQSRELLAQSCKVISIDKDPRYSSLSTDKLRTNLHLRARSNEFSAVIRLKSRFFMETHKFFSNRDFFHVDTPVFTANDCEGAGETFSVIAGSSADKNFFGKKEVFLSVSGQLHLEAICSGVSRVYTLNSGLRAEKQQSSSHLSEFRMLEVEQAFCDNLSEICDVVEDYVKHCASIVIENGEFMKDHKAMSSFTASNHDQILSSIAKTERYPRITYNDAINILAENKQERDGNGLSKRNELFLVEHFKSPIFVTHFPISQKPLYMKRSSDGTVTESFDLLCPLVGELAGGSVREPCYEELKARGVDIDWYLDLRRRGKPISSGFGVGFERLLQVLLGITNIKDAIPFPRWYKHCQC